ncbi:Gx transporter family protein [bacterium]|nr:Gx transporter family protein [bacterium]
MTARSVARLALLVAVAVTLQIAESLIPKPLPWLRLGLANGVTLLAIVRLGPRAALALTAVRVFLGALLLGTLGGPAFFLSASGGLAATVVMIAVHRCCAPRVSVLGVSVAGSAAHVAAQLGALGALTGAGGAVLALAPVLAASAVPLGLVTGAVVLAAHRRLAPWEGAW